MRCLRCVPDPVQVQHTVLRWQWAVSGLDLFMGYAYEGSFRGAVDNVSYAFDTPDPTFNFEVDAGISTTPEPATMSLMAFGLAGMAGAGIRRRKRSR